MGIGGLRYAKFWRYEACYWSNVRRKEHGSTWWSGNAICHGCISKVQDFRCNHRRQWEYSPCLFYWRRRKRCDLCIKVPECCYERQSVFPATQRPKNIREFWPVRNLLPQQGYWLGIAAVLIMVRHCALVQKEWHNAERQQQLWTGSRLFIWERYPNKLW